MSIFSSEHLPSISSQQDFDFFGCCQSRKRDDEKYPSLLPQTTPTSAKTESYFTSFKALGSFLPRQFQSHSMGIIRYQDGPIYKGELRYGKPHGKGTLTFANRNVYTGAFIDGKRHGQGTLKSPTGALYIGDFINDKIEGHGTITDANGNKYIGDFVNGKRHGAGTLTTAHGDIFEGSFTEDFLIGNTSNLGNLCCTRLLFGCMETGAPQEILPFTSSQEDFDVFGSSQPGKRDDEKHSSLPPKTSPSAAKTEGCFSSLKALGSFLPRQLQGISVGIITNQDGSIYEGELRYGKPHGEGTLKFTNGDVYTGTFIDGKRHGRGTLTSLTGALYIGDFADDKFHGYGSLTYANGNMYKGNFVNGKLAGLGTLTTAHGDTFTGIFDQDFLLSDKSNLGDLPCARLLFGFMATGAPQEYMLGIASDHLKGTKHQKLANSLIAAHELLRNKPYLAAKIVYEAIQKGTSYLLPYGYSGHSMGLNLEPTPDGQFVDCEFFNTGGVMPDCHPVKLVDRRPKRETMITVRVPIAELTREKIQQLIESNKFSTVEECYDAVFDLPDVKIIPGTGVLQTTQTTGNCTWKWILAFLKNKMSREDYNQMRIQLFLACLRKAKENEKNGSPPLTDAIPEGYIRHKLNKLLGTDWESLTSFLDEGEGSHFMDDKGHMYPNGDVYKGSFVNGKREGYGTLTFYDEDGGYTGYFKDDKYHGQGAYTYPNGDIHTGSFFNGMPNGQGTLKLANGDSYKGNFVNGEIHGQAIYIKANGEVLTGNFIPEND